MEYAEAGIVFFHRVLVLYVLATIYYCVDEHGLCRPLPFKFYLQGLPDNDKFSRDPGPILKNFFVLTDVVVVLIKARFWPFINQGLKSLAKIYDTRRHENFRWCNWDSNTGPQEMKTNPHSYGCPSNDTVSLFGQKSFRVLGNRCRCWWTFWSFSL